MHGFDFFGILGENFAIDAVSLLTQQGCDPGVTDLIAMLREEAL
jgi:hypothetical protein